MHPLVVNRLLEKALKSLYSLRRQGGIFAVDSTIDIKGEAEPSSGCQSVGWSVPLLSGQRLVNLDLLNST